jgi:hypothetical protein
MKKTLLYFTIIFLFSACQEVGDNVPLLSNKKEKQPIIIVNKNRHLNIAEFWIDNIKYANKIIMKPKEIEKFNNHISYKEHKLTYFKDMGRSYGSAWVKKSIEGMLKSISVQAQYFEDGNRIPNSFFNEIREYIDLGSMDSRVRTRYALAVNYTNQRVIPTELSLLKKKEQIFFDRNQNSALDIATPIAILHTTKDGKWHYGVAPTSSGWVRDKDIAFGSKKDIQNYLNTKKFVVTIDAKSPVLIAGKYHDYLRMGVRLPYMLSIDDMIMVLIPTRDDNGKLILSNATIKSTHLNKGYLSYTPKNILTQAFKFINAPYGWGGSFGEQDCSKFIQEIYATVGVKMPRNSLSQSSVGDRFFELDELTKEAKTDLLIESATIGTTIVHLKGHIMLYIGDYKGEPYVIQTVWGESKKHYALGRTAVTSLNFNDYIYKIDKATLIQP